MVKKPGRRAPVLRRLCRLIGPAPPWCDLTMAVAHGRAAKDVIAGVLQGAAGQT